MQYLDAADLAPMLNARMSEKAYQWRIVSLAWQLGWWTYHVHDSRRSEPGFPDLVLIRDRIIYAEVKTERGTLTGIQEAVIERIRRADGEVYVWRPSDYQQVQEVLQ